MDGAGGTTVKKIISEEKTIRFIREELDTNPSRDMASMARLLCEKLHLKSADGRMRQGCCISALRSLASRGIVSFKKKRLHRRVPSMFRPCLQAFQTASKKWGTV